MPKSFILFSSLLNVGPRKMLQIQEGMEGTHARTHTHTQAKRMLSDFT